MLDNSGAVGMCAVPTARGDGLWRQRPVPCRAGRQQRPHAGASPGRRQPESAQVDAATTSPGDGRATPPPPSSVPPPLLLPPGARGTRTGRRALPQARAVNNMHVHKLNASARLHCHHLVKSSLRCLPPSSSPSFLPSSSPLKSRSGRAPLEIHRIVGTESQVVACDCRASCSASNSLR